MEYFPADLADLKGMQIFADLIGQDYKNLHQPDIDPRDQRVFNLRHQREKVFVFSPADLTD